MIELVCYEDYKIFDRIKKYVNEQLSDVVRTFIDIMDDNNGFEIDYFLPLHNLRGDNKEWEQKVRELYEILISQSTRNSIKPYYEYLLYLILEWYIDCNTDEYKLLHFTIPSTLKNAIICSDDIYEDEKANILNNISDLNNYFELVFWDRDFYPDNVSNMVCSILITKKSMI